MPYRRLIRLDTPLVGWQELTLLESQPAWSEAYRPETARLLLPQSRWIECEQGSGPHARRFVCDALAPLWITPEAPYRMRQPFGGQRSVVLVFAAPPWRSVRGSAGNTRRPVLSAGTLWRLARLGAALTQGEADALEAEETLLAIGGEALGTPSPTPEKSGIAVALTPRLHRAAEAAREQLAAEPSANLSLAQIAAAAAASPFHLARGFRAINGIGLHGYRTRLRMATALARLAEGERCLTTLALDLGYSSHSHFSAAFRRQFGHSPLQMRRNLTARRGASRPDCLA